MYIVDCCRLGDDEITINEWEEAFKLLGTRVLEAMSQGKPCNLKPV